MTNALLRIASYCGGKMIEMVLWLAVYILHLGVGIAIALHGRLLLAAFVSAAIIALPLVTSCPSAPLLNSKVTSDWWRRRWEQSRFWSVWPVSSWRFSGGCKKRKAKESEFFSNAAFHP